MHVEHPFIAVHVPPTHTAAQAMTNAIMQPGTAHCATVDAAPMPMNAKVIVPHIGHITEHLSQQLLQQRPCTVWLTGLSGSGKSTLAYALEERLYARARSGVIPHFTGISAPYEDPQAPDLDECMTDIRAHIPSAAAIEQSRSLSTKRRKEAWEQLKPAW